MADHAVHAEMTREYYIPQNNGEIAKATFWSYVLFLVMTLAVGALALYFIR